jgi:hypothetical protein
VQRLLTVGAARRAHADCHEAAVGYSDRRWSERRLYEVLRSYDLRHPAGAAPPTASPSPGLVVPTLSGHLALNLEPVIANAAERIECALGTPLCACAWCSGSTYFGYFHHGVIVDQLSPSNHRGLNRVLNIFPKWHPSRLAFRDYGASLILLLPACLKKRFDTYDPLHEG